MRRAISDSDAPAQKCCTMTDATSPSLRRANISVASSVAVSSIAAVNSEIFCSASIIAVVNFSVVEVSGGVDERGKPSSCRQRLFTDKRNVSSRRISAASCSRRARTRFSSSNVIINHSPKIGRKTRKVRKIRKIVFFIFLKKRE